VSGKSIFLKIVGKKSLANFRDRRKICQNRGNIDLDWENFDPKNVLRFPSCSIFPFEF